VALSLSGPKKRWRCVFFIQVAYNFFFFARLSAVASMILIFVGAFLIPYFVMLAIEGIPIFYLELAIGQRLRKGAIGVWNQVNSNGLTFYN